MCVSPLSLQSDVRVKVHVEGREARESWYRLVLRYSNPSGSSVTGTVEATGIRAAPGKAASLSGVGSHVHAPPTHTHTHTHVHTHVECVMFRFL